MKTIDHARSNTHCGMLLLITLVAILTVAAGAQLNLAVNVGSHHKLVESRHGTFLFNSKDTWIGRSLDLYGEWSESEISLISNYIEDGDVVADVGANIGTFTVSCRDDVCTFT